MSTQENGIPANVSSPAAIPILSSTNANPIVVATNGSHGLTTGDQVDIDGHAGNPPANGIQWVVTVLSNTTFSIPVAGSGAGAANGSVRPLTAGSTFAIPSDGVDLETAASVNVPFNALADRTAYSISRGGAYETDFLVTDYNSNATLSTGINTGLGSFVQMGALVTSIPVAQVDVLDFTFTSVLQAAIAAGAPGASVSFSLQLRYAYYPYGGAPSQVVLAGTNSVWQFAVTPASAAWLMPVSMVGRIGGTSSANVINGTLGGANTFGLLDIYLWVACVNNDATHTATMTLQAAPSVLTRRHWRPTGLLR